MSRLSWATALVGAWEIISQWVIQQSGSHPGIVLNNVITGGVTFLLGIGAAAILMRGPRRAR